MLLVLVKSFKKVYFNGLPCRINSKRVYFRYKETFFRSKDALLNTKAKLVSLVLAEMDAGEEPMVQDASSSSAGSTISEEDCSTSIIAQISKKIRLEKRLEVVCCVSSDVQCIHPGY